MAYQDWFDGYQRGEVALRGYFRPPEELTAESVQGMDRNAADLQRRAQALIDNLAEYRQSLAARYAALMVMPYEWRHEADRATGELPRQGATQSNSPIQGAVQGTARHNGHDGHSPQSMGAIERGPT